MYAAEYAAVAGYDQSSLHQQVLGKSLCRTEKFIIMTCRVCAV